MTIKTVTILFARADSIYKTLDHCDVYDQARDALTWQGSTPIVAHPPCRAWGALANFARPLPGERELAPWAIEQIRLHGGVLEHPAASKLWKELSLPHPGATDKFGGWTLGIHQSDFGHRAEKKTLLYIVGCNPAAVPPIPHPMHYPSHVIATSRMKRHRPEVTKAEREATPEALAQWLVTVARACD